MQNQNTDIATDLRNQIAALEGHQIELVAERDELSYAALVDRKPDAIKRLTAVNGELANITAQTASLTAALREAGKREVAAMEEARASIRHENARAAGDLLTEIEVTAGAITQAMEDLKAHSITLRDQFAEIRRLTGVGPTNEALRVHLTRTLKVATMGSLMQIEHLAPDQRSSFADTAAAWIKSVSNWISQATGEKSAAKKAA
jgi:hypothetical protein